MKGNGTCLCGSVTIEAEFPSNELSACHCEMCRTWSGSPMLAIESSGEVNISNPSDVVRYPSSEWAERGFCGKCGTHLFYYLKPNNQYHIPIGLLHTDSDCHLSHQIFIDEKPAYYEFKNETKNMTGAEVFAYFENGS